MAIVVGCTMEPELIGVAGVFLLSPFFIFKNEKSKALKSATCVLMHIPSSIIVVESVNIVLEFWKKDRGARRGAQGRGAHLTTPSIFITNKAIYFINLESVFI